MKIDNFATVSSGGLNETTGPKAVPVDKVRPEVPAVVNQEQNELTLQNEQKRLKETVEQANKALEGSGRHFKYEIHEPTNQVVISVVDNKTNEVMTEIPARKLLDVVSKLMELAGLFIDERR